jgi:Ni,Fe-hydrogenase III component G
MDTETALKTAAGLLQPWTVETRSFEANRLDVYLAASDLPAAAAALVDAGWGYLSALTGLDHPAPAPTEGDPVVEEQLEALYHFCEGAAVVTLRASVPVSHPVIPTVCGVIPTATLFERELMEMFGFVVEGTPVMDRLVLPDDFPQGLYPLRKALTSEQIVAEIEKGA